jgi:hypothetical protein
MKNKIWTGLLAVLAVIVALSIWLFMSRSKPDTPPLLAATGPVSYKVELAPPPQTAWDRWSQHSGEDMSDFTNLFEQRFKPAIAKWCKVYAGRLPFNESEVTPDKFHSKVGKFLHTFMIGSTTFTVYDGPEGTRVFYMMTRQAAQQLNSVPSGGVMHDISTPVSRQVILDLLKADAGIEFPADQISIHPTGTFTSMDGGVSVETGGITADNVYRIMTRTNLDFVLDGNGQLVSYQH